MVSLRNRRAACAITAMGVITASLVPRTALATEPLNATGGAPLAWTALALIGLGLLGVAAGAVRMARRSASQAKRLSAELEASERALQTLTASADAERQQFENEQRTQAARLESILSSLPDGVLVLDRNHRVVHSNPVVEEYIRQSEGQYASASDWSKNHETYLLDGVTPLPAESGPLIRAGRGDACDPVELVIRAKSGIPRAFRITASPIEDGHGLAGCVAVYHDITEELHAERELTESERRWRILSEASFEGVALSRQGWIVDTNETLARWVGRTPESLLGVHVLTAFTPDDKARVAKEAGDPAAFYEGRVIRADGSTFPVEVRSRGATVNGEKVRISVIRDVTEKREREAELKNQAELLRALSLRDELTTLYNRRGFLELARQQLRNATRARRHACLFFADLNGMKVINDSHGHDAGDRALAHTASILSSVFREADVVARLGGDEFAAFAAECDAEGSKIIRNRVQAAVDAFNAGASEPYRLSISLGSALFDPQKPVALEPLMATADAKMYDEKKARSATFARVDSVQRIEEETAARRQA